MNLSYLSLAKYKFILQAEEMLTLPSFKGSIFRGGFGSVFRKIICVNKKKDCSHCLLKDECIYSYIFETPVPTESTYINKNKISTIPHPFIIEPPLEKKERYEPGETLSFNLILIGKAISYLSYFIFTFEKLGEVGLGRERAHYKLLKVESFKNPSQRELIYNSQTQTLKKIDTQIDISQIFSFQQLTTGSITINFLTPVRIKYQGSYTSYPAFHIISRSLLRRLSYLLYFHCGRELNIDYKEIIEKAKKIETLKATIHWIDWERYSSRQHQTMKLGGFVGKVSYKGEMERFLPFLKAGEYIHLGKATVFGLGKYEIMERQL